MGITWNLGETPWPIREPTSMVFVLRGECGAMAPGARRAPGLPDPHTELPGLLPRRLRCGPVPDRSFSVGLSALA
jgi:hypothetical protein